MAEKKNKRTGIGLAIWLIIAIVIVIIFLVKWETIHNNLIKVGILQGTVVEKEEKPVTKKPQKAEAPKNKETISIKVQNDEPVVVKVDEPEKETVKPVEKNPEEEEVKAETKAEEKPVEKPVEKPAPVQATSNAKLCFVVIDANGLVNYKTVTRSYAKNDSPLVTSINMLLQGPMFQNAAEKNCTTLIPKGTKLLGASVKDGVATLNFNDAFEFNSDGIEGYIGQLKQIINTATEFSSVKSVQFLINGQKKEYLGSDGVWIGTPLGPNSL